MDHKTHVQIGVGRSVRCVKCDYPLQGLFADSNCPECGSPIEGSVLMVDMPVDLLPTSTLQGSTQLKRIAWLSASLAITALIIYLLFLWLN